MVTIHFEVHRHRVAKNICQSQIFDPWIHAFITIFFYGVNVLRIRDFSALMFFFQLTASGLGSPNNRAQRIAPPHKHPTSVMTPCRTEKVGFSKKIKTKKKQNHKKNKSTGRITRRNKKKTKKKQKKLRKMQVLICFLIFFVVFCFFVFFLFFPWLWFSSLFFLFALVLFFFCQTLYSLCCWTHKTSGKCPSVSGCVFWAVLLPKINIIIDIHMIHMIHVLKKYILLHDNI